MTHTRALLMRFRQLADEAKREGEDVEATTWLEARAMLSAALERDRVTRVLSAEEIAVAGSIRLEPPKPALSVRLHRLFRRT